jgi:hypothetical protein
MRLYAQRLELKVVCSLCSAKTPPSVKSFLFKSLDELHFRFPPWRVTFNRIKFYHDRKKRNVHWDEIIEDMAIDEDYRLLLRENGKEVKPIRSEKFARDCIKVLNEYRSARTLYDSAKDIIESLLKPKVDVGEISGRVIDLFRREMKKSGGNPAFLYTPERLEETVNFALEVFPKMRGEKIYQRDGVRMLVDSHAEKILRDPEEKDHHVLIPATDAYLNIRLTGAVDWSKPAGHEGKKTERIDCPDKVSRGVIHVPSKFWKDPPLTMVTSCPVLRRDGTVLDRPGYDETSGILFQPGDLDYGGIPRKPSKRLAEKCLEYLRQPLDEFLYAQPYHESVNLSSILTPFNRHNMDCAPIHCNSGPGSGSAKTLRTDIPSIIFTGHAAVAVIITGDPTEDRKTFFAILLGGGDPIISLDNVPEILYKNDSLCSMTTSKYIQGRILGVSKMGQVSTKFTFMMNGNNLRLGGTLAERSLISYVDPKCKRPQEMEFERKNLRAWTLEHRATLVRASLIIQRAYIYAGCPDQQLKPYREFRDWERTSRAPLVWLGMPDPCDSLRETAENDNANQECTQACNTWKEEFKTEAVTVQQAVKEAGVRDNLKTALLEVAGIKGEINATKLSYWLRSVAKKPVPDLNKPGYDLRFEARGTDHTGAAKWKAVSLKTRDK